MATGIIFPMSHFMGKKNIKSSFYLLVYQFPHRPFSASPFLAITDAKH